MNVRTERPINSWLQAYYQYPTNAHDTEDLRRFRDRFRREEKTGDKEFLQRLARAIEQELARRDDVTEADFAKMRWVRPQRS